jgi:peptidoglycan/xylan/chitin deacetylase (PgdA/CDA1 family)
MGLPHLLPRVRLAVLRVLDASGAFGLARRSAWRSRRLLILCFHGFSIADEHLWNPNLYLPGEHLEGRLRRLRDGGYAILPLGEALERLYAGSLPSGAVALTVDDGFFDFLALAYPILARAGVPATVYASTYYVFDQRPIFDVACDYLLWKGQRLGRGRVDLSGNLNGFDLSAPGAPGVVAALLRRAAADEGWSADRKHECLERLAAAVGVDWGEFRRRRMLSLLTPEEIAALDPRIADVQLHTHRHRMPDDRALFLREIEDNRNGLIRAGRPASDLRHFCYPSGLYAAHHLPWLKEAGVVSATTTEPGLASRASDPLHLPRYIVTYLTPDVEFDAWASGVRAVLGRPGWLRG